MLEQMLEGKCTFIEYDYVFISFNTITFGFNNGYVFGCCIS